MKKKRVRSRKTYRKPSYSAAVNLARIVDEMPRHPFGWELADLADYLRVSVRTVRRYAKVLADEFTDDEGQPVFVIEKRGEQSKLIRKSRPREDLPESIYHLISVYLSLEFFRMLGENVVAFSVEDVFKRAEKRLSPKERDLVRDLSRKFYNAPSAPKDYSAHVDILEGVIKAIVYQNTVKMIYKPAEREPWHYTVHPLTLLFHKGGFYLIAKPVKRKNPVTFNIERIKELEVTKDKFEYPNDYHPEKLLDGAFGIFVGPAKEVKLKFPPELAEYITSRKWHESQKFKYQKDGSVIMTMKVTDSEELRSWVRSFGEGVKVLQ